MSEFIYVLKWLDSTNYQSYPFYVGRTNNLDRRFKEHMRDSIDGTEDKYVFMRELSARNLSWVMITECEIPDGMYPIDYEDTYFVNYVKAGFMMYNMKHGDAERRQSILDGMVEGEIRTVDEVQQLRIKKEKEVEEKKFTKSEALRLKVIAEEEELKNSAAVIVGDRKREVEDLVNMFMEKKAMRCDGIKNWTIKLDGVVYLLAKRVDRGVHIMDVTVWIGKVFKSHTFKGRVLNDLINTTMSGAISLRNQIRRGG